MYVIRQLCTALSLRRSSTRYAFRYGPAIHLIAKTSSSCYINEPARVSKSTLECALYRCIPGFVAECYWTWSLTTHDHFCRPSSRLGGQRKRPHLLPRAQRQEHHRSIFT